MFSLYLQVTQALRAQVPNLRTIDLDKGQLDYPDQFESILHPGVLVSDIDIDWEPIGQRKEMGTGTITVKTVVRLPSRTHNGNPLIDANVEALLIADDVHDVVMTMPGVTNRTKSKCYPSGTFYIVENTYSAQFKYGGPKYRLQPVSVQINPTVQPIAQA